jgi:hypothetical protein
MGGLLFYFRFPCCVSIWLILSTLTFFYVQRGHTRLPNILSEWLQLCFVFRRFQAQVSDIIRQIKSRRMRWAGHVARTGEGRNVYRVSVGKPEGERPLGWPRRGWEDGIKMDLRDIGWGGVEWIHLAQDRDRWRAVVGAVMNLGVLAPRSWLVWLKSHPRHWLSWQGLSAGFVTHSW